MIFVSSACSKKKNIGAAVHELADNGFHNIELTGGTNYYDGYEEDLLSLRDKYKLQYGVHNYFPPPRENFVVNLASLDGDIYQKSLSHLKSSVSFCRHFGVEKFGFHAGFYLELASDMLGRKVAPNKLCDIRKADRQFIQGLREIVAYAEGMEIYLENNVYSAANFKSFGQDVPFMLLHAADFQAIENQVDCKLLLDVAHLYVTAKTLGFDFHKELETMLGQSDYIHLSANDGKSDQNKGIKRDGFIYNALKPYSLHGKIITLEIYENMTVLQESLETMTELARG